MIVSNLRNPQVVVGSARVCADSQDQLVAWRPSEEAALVIDRAILAGQEDVGLDIAVALRLDERVFIVVGVERHGADIQLDLHLRPG